VQERSITRGLPAVVVAAALLLATTVVPRAQFIAVSPRPATPPPSSAEWREAPEYVALFAPRLVRDAYRTFVSTVSLEQAVRVAAADEAAIAVAAPGAWRPSPENPLDAFGLGGPYDRGTLARLYGSHRPTVARGPRGRSGTVEESWTLISPFPSADLERIHQGTLLLILRVP
jgi:hypothetical protein